MAAPSSGAIGAMAPRRTARPRWKDPRLLLGIVLVLTSVVLGARVIASFDDAERYWALAHDVRAGDTVAPEQLIAVDARLAGGDAAYLRVDEELPARLDELRWSTDVSSGALVAQDYWQDQAELSVLEVPVLAQVGALPHDLTAGDLVDVWVSLGDEAAADTVQIWSAVRIASVGDPAETMAGLGRTVLLAVEDSAPSGADLGRLAAGDVLLVRRS